MSVSWVTDATLRDPARVTRGLPVLVGAVAASVGAVPPPMAGPRPRRALGAFRQPCPPAQEIKRNSVPRLRSSANGRRRVVFLEGRQRSRRSPVVAGTRPEWGGVSPHTGAVLGSLTDR